MSGIETDGQDPSPVRFRLCVRCFRAVPTSANERYCINDGTQLLEQCPSCKTPISSPYARFCAVCGSEFGLADSGRGRSEMKTLL